MMNNFGRVKKVVFTNTSSKSTYTQDDVEIRFDVEFDDDGKSNISTIELYNLSSTSKNNIQSGTKVDLYAGYINDIGVILSGVVSSKTPSVDGLDEILTVKVIEGADYTSLKKQISFAPGTSGMQIVNKLVSELKIALDSKPVLGNNKNYPKGYVVTGQVLNNLVEVIQDCGSQLFYRKGKLTVRPLNDKGINEYFTLSPETGLIESPTYFENSDYKGYKVKSLIQHRITVGSKIVLKSKVVSGEFRVKSGKHSDNGTNAYTELELI